MTSIERMQETLLRARHASSLPANSLPQFTHADRQRVIYAQTFDLINLSTESEAYRQLNALYYRYPDDWAMYQAFAMDHLTAQFEHRWGFPPLREAVRVFSQPEHLLRFWLALSLGIIRVQTSSLSGQSGVARSQYIFEPPGEIYWPLTPTDVDPDSILPYAIRAFCAEKDGQASFTDSSAASRQAARPRYAFDQPTRSVASTSNLALVPPHENPLLRWVDDMFAQAAKESSASADDFPGTAADGTNPSQQISTQAALWRERAMQPTTPKPARLQMLTAAAEIRLLAKTAAVFEARGNAAEQSRRVLVRDLCLSSTLVIDDHIKRRQQEIAQVLSWLPGAAH
jgi:hypothetical protein